MKKTVMYLCTIIILFFASCKKQKTLESVSLGKPIATKPIVEQREYVKNNFKIIAKEFAKIISEPLIRLIIRNKALEKFDDDYNVLIKSLIEIPEISNKVNLEKIKLALDAFKNIDGNNYYPQIYIPKLSKSETNRTNDDTETATFVLYDGDETVNNYPGYQLNYDGEFVPTGTPITENDAINHEVYVLSLNETVNNSGDVPIDNSTTNTQDVQDLSNGVLSYRINKMIVKHHKESWAAGKSDIAIKAWQETWNGTISGQVGAPLASAATTYATTTSELGYYVKKFSRSDVNNQNELTLERYITLNNNFNNYFSNPIVLHWVIFERDLWPKGIKTTAYNPLLGSVNTMNQTYTPAFRSADDCYFAYRSFFYANKSGITNNLSSLIANTTYVGNYLTEHREENTTIKYNIIY